MSVRLPTWSRCHLNAMTERLALEVGAIYAESRGCYGSPRVHAELRARRQPTGRKRVARLMQGGEFARS